VSKKKGSSSAKRLTLYLHPAKNPRAALILHCLDRQAAPISESVYDILLEWALKTSRLLAKEKYATDDITLKHMSAADLLEVMKGNYSTSNSLHPKPVSTPLKTVELVGEDKHENTKNTPCCDDSDFTIDDL
jgi:hypothetical protein